MPEKLKVTSQDKEALLKIKRLLEGNLSVMFTIKQLCKYSGLNSDKLKKGFRILYGLPPGCFHRNLKMKQAQHLLQTTDLQVCEIAWELGYDGVPGFCRAFKRYSAINALAWKATQHEKSACVVTS